MIKLEARPSGCTVYADEPVRIDLTTAAGGGVVWVYRGTAVDLDQEPDANYVGGEQLVSYDNPEPGVYLPFTAPLELAQDPGKGSLYAIGHSELRGETREDRVRDVQRWVDQYMEHTIPRDGTAVAVARLKVLLGTDDFSLEALDERALMDLHDRLVPPNPER